MFDQPSLWVHLCIESVCNKAARRRLLPNAPITKINCHHVLYLMDVKVCANMLRPKITQNAIPAPKLGIYPYGLPTPSMAATQILRLIRPSDMINRFSSHRTKTVAQSGRKVFFSTKYINQNNDTESQHSARGTRKKQRWQQEKIESAKAVLKYQNWHATSAPLLVRLAETDRVNCFPSTRDILFAILPLSEVVLDQSRHTGIGRHWDQHRWTGFQSVEHCPFAWRNSWRKWVVGGLERWLVVRIHFWRNRAFALAAKTWQGKHNLRIAELPYGAKLREEISTMS